MAKQRLTKEQRFKRRQRVRRKLVGLVFLLLALIGVAAIVVVVVNQVNVLLDDTDERLEYENLYATLVSLDPATFTSLEKANQDMLRTAVVMTTLQLENTDNYRRDDFDRILLPISDVDTYARRLFGPNYQVPRESFGGDGTITPSDGIDHTGYVYVEEEQAFAVPPTSLAGSYIPRIENIERSGNTKILTIAYLYNPSSIGDVLTNPDELRVSKYMDYVLLKEGSEFYLYSIRESTYTPPEVQAAS